MKENLSAVHGSYADLEQHVFMLLRNLGLVNYDARKDYSFAFDEIIEQVLTSFEWSCTLTRTVAKLSHVESYDDTGYNTRSKVFWHKPVDLLSIKRCLSGYKVQLHISGNYIVYDSVAPDMLQDTAITIEYVRRVPYGEMPPHLRRAVQYKIAEHIAGEIRGDANAQNELYQKANIEMEKAKQTEGMTRATWQDAPYNAVDAHRNSGYGSYLGRRRIR